MLQKVQEGLLAGERWMRLRGFFMTEVDADVTTRRLDRVGKTGDEDRRFIADFYEPGGTDSLEQTPRRRQF